jgi:hypothetical protein
MHRTRALAAMLVTSLAVVLGCPTDSGSGSKNVGLTVTSGPFSYAVTAHVPLPNNGGALSCTATASGLVTVSSNGGYTITFPALSCSGCTMTASSTGTITSTAVNGTVAATISGAGCSVQQPTPNPATVSGTCNQSGCSAVNPDGESFSVSYTLTPATAS